MFTHNNVMNALILLSFIFITGCGSDSTPETFPVPTAGCGFDSNPSSNLKSIPANSRVYASNTVLLDTCGKGAIWASDGSKENTYLVENNQYKNLKQHNNSWYFTIGQPSKGYSIIKYSQSGKNIIFSSKAPIIDLTFVGNKLYFLSDDELPIFDYDLHEDLWVLEEGSTTPHKVELNQSKYIHDIMSGGDHLIMHRLTLITINDGITRIVNETIDRLDDDNTVNTVANLSKIHDSYFYRLLFSHNNQVIIETKNKKYFRVSKATTKCEVYDSVSKPLASFQGTLYFSKKINSRYELRAEKKQNGSALIALFDHDISLNSTNGSLFLTSANTEKTDIKLWKIDTVARKKELISSLTNDLDQNFGKASSINDNIYYSISTSYFMGRNEWNSNIKIFQYKNPTPIASGDLNTSVIGDTRPKISFINNSLYYSSASIRDEDYSETRSLYIIDNATGISKKLALCY